jgi:elongator complex protein 1
MSSYTITLPSTPVHVSLSHTEDALAVLYRNGLVQIWDLNTRIPEPKGGSKLRGGGKVAEPKLRVERRMTIGDGEVAKQISIGENRQLAVLFSSSSDGAGDHARILDGEEEEKRYSLETPVEKITWSGESGFLALASDGHVFSSKLGLSPRM